MIKIDKDLENVPPSLTSQTTKQRRDELIEIGQYISQDKYDNRYKGQDVKRRLKELYRGKCAFCEQCIEQFHVEHFRPKRIYYWLAYSWDNLLAVCPVCNQNKRDHFEVVHRRISISQRDVDIERIHYLADAYNETEGNRLVHPEKETVEALLIFGKDGSIASEDKRVDHTIETCSLDRNDLKDKRKTLWNDLEGKLNSRLLEHQSGDTEALAKMRGLLEDFARDSDDNSKDFIAFRRYVTQHFLPK